MAFVVQYPVFLLHLVLLSFCSAVGQVFIFRTLSLYGALVFAVVMTFVWRRMAAAADINQETPLTDAHPLPSFHSAGRGRCSASFCPPCSMGTLSLLW